MYRVSQNMPKTMALWGICGGDPGRVRPTDGTGRGDRLIETDFDLCPDSPHTMDLLTMRRPRLSPQDTLSSLAHSGSTGSALIRRILGSVVLTLVLTLTSVARAGDFPTPLTAMPSCGEATGCGEGVGCGEGGGSTLFGTKDGCSDCGSCLFSDEFCKRWHDFGTLYSEPDNELISEWKFVGRFHYQYGLVDGNAGTGEDVNYETDEMRRFRLGTTAKFFKYWDLYAEAEVSDDQRPRGQDLDLRFQHMWQLKTHVDLKKALDLEGIDGLRLGLGSREINMSYEWQTSSKRIKTVERSAIANKIWAFNSEFANPTGAWLITEQKPLTWTFGVFSTTQDDWLASFNDGELYYSNLHWDVSEGEDEETDVRWTAFYQDIDANDEVLAAGLEWATALSMQRKKGPWELQLEGILGDNGDQSSVDREGNFWAAVVMPSYWIVDHKLEAVARFQYQGSQEAEGIRLNSRYVRRAGSRDNIPSLVNGRGDEHYSVYAGINRLFCEHQQKVMFGVEYDSISSNGAEVFEGWSLFAAYRTYW